jgi:acetolactate synthase small subunit
MSTHTFVLKVADRPGAMELIAAAFAQRGVSLSTSLGNDGALDAEGRGTVLLTFTATPAKKEVLRRALGRLSRVLSLVEYPLDSPLLRKSALLRLAAGAPAPALPAGVSGLVEKISGDTAHGEGALGEGVYLVVGPALAVDEILNRARVAGHLRDATHTTISL